MPRILRALLVSAAATGLAAVLLSVLSRKPSGPALPAAEGPDMDLEGLSEQEKRILMQELDEQL